MDDGAETTKTKEKTTTTSKRRGLTNGSSYEFIFACCQKCPTRSHQKRSTHSQKVRQNSRHRRIVRGFEKHYWKNEKKIRKALRFIPQRQGEINRVLDWMLLVRTWMTYTRLQKYITSPRQWHLFAKVWSAYLDKHTF